MKAINLTRNIEICSRVEKAEGFFSRLAGLIPRSGLDAQEGLWIPQCGMIHTCFMKFAIDAVFLDRNMKIVRVLVNLKPWRFSPLIIGAKSVLELGAGKTNSLVTEGDIIEIK
ncbi:MAG: DUF192 domain-containing protein [Elusimicrobia bacterium]|nr:DUF192 domain-containing protein [Elusimicrobiota bacterium]